MTLARPCPGAFAGPWGPAGHGARGCARARLSGSGGGWVAPLVWWVSGWCVEGGVLTGGVEVSMQLRFRREGLIVCLVDRGGLSVGD